MVYLGYQVSAPLAATKNAPYMVTPCLCGHYACTAANLKNAELLRLANGLLLELGLDRGNEENVDLVLNYFELARKTS